MSLEDRLYPLLSVYERLPQGVKRAIGWSYRQLPVGFRLGERYAEFRELTQACENWSVEEVRDYQFKQLRQTLIHADNYCPYYQRRFAGAKFRPAELRSLEELKHCPLLTKADLLQHSQEMLSSAQPEKKRLYITTGGSTGVPVGFYLHKGVSRPKEQAFLEAQWKRGGYFDGARLAVIRGHVTSDKAQGSITSYDATRDWLMLSSYHLSEERLPEYLDAIEKFKPDLLHAYPSAALQLAEFLERAGQTWRTPLKGLLAAR